VNRDRKPSFDVLNGLMETLYDPSTVNLQDHGAQLFYAAVAGDIAKLQAAVEKVPKNHAGVRLKGIDSLQPFLQPMGSVGSIAADILGPKSRAVRAILFDKTAETNWSLAWHQDRTICVKQRIDVAGFGPWTMKGGMQQRRTAIRPPNAHGHPPSSC